METTIGPRERTPLYRQVFDVLSREIRDGTYPPHAQIPTEDALIARFQVSRAPIRQALQELVARGLVYRQRGRGSFVTGPPLVKSAERLGGLIDYLGSQGIATSTRVRDAHWILPPRPIAEQLMLRDDAEVYVVTRLIYRDYSPSSTGDGTGDDGTGPVPPPSRQPAAWTRTYLNIPRHISYTSEQLEDAGTVLVLLERDHGISMRKGRQMIWASSATVEQASDLGIAVGDPVLAASLLVVGVEGLPLAYSETVHPAELFRYVFEVTR